MTADADRRVALVWRGDRQDRLAPMFDVLAAVGIETTPIVYSDASAAEVRQQLLNVAGVLVWVDPIGEGEDRTLLDAVLTDVVSAGVWVSARPDTVQRIGTKEVLVRARHLGWGSDTHLYATASEFEREFPTRLAAGAPRVLKQNRGNGGIGVWKVERLDATSVRVQHAQSRDAVTEDIALIEFMRRCEPYLAGTGRIVDQPFMTRITEGMIRAYVVVDEVVGFARQQPLTNDGVLGLPSAKTMFGPEEPEFAALRASLERQWIPGLQRAVDIETSALPVLWDCDFLFGPPTAAGDDTYVLCEINVSSVIPFPDTAPNAVALAVQRKLASR